MATGSNLQAGQYDYQNILKQNPMPDQFIADDGSSVERTLPELNSGATHNSPKPITPPLPASDLNTQSARPPSQRRLSSMSPTDSRPPTPQYPPDTQESAIGALQGQSTTMQRHGSQSTQVESVIAIEGLRPRTPSISPPVELSSATITQDTTAADHPKSTAITLLKTREKQ